MTPDDAAAIEREFADAGATVTWAKSPDPGRVQCVVRHGTKNVPFDMSECKAVAMLAIVLGAVRRATGKAA